MNISLRGTSSDDFQATIRAGGRTAIAPGLTPSDAYAFALRPLMPFLDGLEKRWAEQMLGDFEAGATCIALQEGGADRA
jgi:hypothetical protein